MCKKLVFLTIASLVLGTAPANAASMGPVGWWKFDETSGTTAVDSVAGRNGTLLPANANPVAAWVPGKLGGAIQFGRAAGAAANAGTNPYVELPISDLLGTLGDTTFALWVNWAGSSNGDWQRIFDFGAGTTVYAFLAANRAGTASPRFAIRNISTGEQTVTAPATLASGWHHMAVVADSSLMRNYLYIDGVAVANAATALLPRDMVAPTGQAWQPWIARSQYPADAYYVGMVDDLRIYDRPLSGDDLVSVMNGGVGFGVANTAVPANSATDVLRDQVLSWTAGTGAVAHDVYFGTDAANLPQVSAGQAETSFNPGRMEFGVTYYWRVDEVQADGSVITGNLWTFTTELLAYKLAVASVIASSSAPNNDPNNVINGSGIDANDLAGTAGNTMWSTAPGAMGPASIQFNFDKIYRLYDMWVWNYNSDFESLLGYGMKDVTIEYSTDGVTWMKLGDYEFAQATSQDGYAHNTTVDFDGVGAKQVRITANSAWGTTGTYGLSEVRFYYIPTYASMPSPANNATGVRPDVTLSWRPGRGVAQNDIYLGTDPNALTMVGDSNTPSFTPAGLQLDATTYYWRVDEVNAAETATIWTGDVWTFTTLTYIVVDDMESYTNDTQNHKAIFQTWIDGVNTTTNGSQVGYITAPFAEQTLVHGGLQSMPFYYANTPDRPISEATRTFDPVQDWTTGGITTLVLFIRPDAANVAGQLYVKINGIEADYPGNLVITPAPLWTEWNIDLTKFSDVKAVKTLTIGVSGMGSGLLFIDDIRLYKTAPSATPKDPGTANLVSYFDMEGDKVFDSISNTTGNLNGTTFVPSLGDYGQALQCSGGTTAETTQYVDLGADYWTNVVSKLSSCTFAVWVNYTGIGNVWSRVFDFGSGPNVNTWITTSAGSAGIARFAVKTNVPNAGSTGAGYVETNVSGPRPLTVGWHHLAGVVDATGGVAGSPVMYLYIDGSIAGGPAPSRLPKDMVIQTPTPWQMWLGRSQYSADPFLNGAIDDLRIYSRVLTPGEVYYLAGGR